MRKKKLSSITFLKWYNLICFLTKKFSLLKKKLIMVLVNSNKSSDCLIHLNEELLKRKEKVAKAIEFSVKGSS